MSEQFGNIYDQYVAKIYRFIALKVESSETAEDLCSEVFLRALKEFEKNSIQNARAFLYQVARYVIADYYRERATMQVVPLEESVHVLQEETSLTQEAEQKGDVEEVRKALGHLREEYQNLIIWRYIDEFSVQEIAEITGKTEGNVRVGIHRALHALREQMPSARQDYTMNELTS